MVILGGRGFNHSLALCMGMNPAKNGSVPAPYSTARQSNAAQVHPWMTHLSIGGIKEHDPDHLKHHVYVSLR